MRVHLQQLTGDDSTAEFSTAFSNSEMETWWKMATPTLNCRVVYMSITERSCMKPSSTTWVILFQHRIGSRKKQYLSPRLTTFTSSVTCWLGSSQASIEFTTPSIQFWKKMSQSTTLLNILTPLPRHVSRTISSSSRLEFRSCYWEILMHPNRVMVHDWSSSKWWTYSASLCLFFYLLMRLLTHLV